MLRGKGLGSPIAINVSVVMFLFDFAPHELPVILVPGYLGFGHREFMVMVTFISCFTIKKSWGVIGRLWDQGPSLIPL